MRMMHVKSFNLDISINPQHVTALVPDQVSPSRTKVYLVSDTTNEASFDVDGTRAEVEQEWLAALYADYYEPPATL